MEVKKRFVAALLGLTSIIFLVSCHKNDRPGSSTLQISAFAPTSGSKGASINITGTGFNPSLTGNIVTINGKPATVAKATATGLTVIVPAGAGDGKITVQTGGQTATSAKDLTYLYTVSTFAGDGLPGFAEGTGVAAQFQFPFAVALDGAGSIFVADAMNHRIRKITPSAEVTTLAGAGYRGFINGPGNQAGFGFPTGIAVDPLGNIYVGDDDFNMVRKVTVAGVVSTVAGDLDSGSADGVGQAARFYRPVGVATDTAGNVFVADYFNNAIRRVTPAGEVTTLAGNGTPGYKDGPGAAAQFYAPIGVAVDRSGYVYVADEGNNMIRKISPSREVSTLAGDTSAGFKDASGTAARFISPIGITADASGNVYVGDWGNHRIRKISPTGAVTTVAGDGQPSFKDGAAVTAHFKYPCGLAIDAAGTIYVADQGNHRIRKLE
jgi:streptogramin lyase